MVPEVASSITLSPVSYKDPDEQRRYQREWLIKRRSEWIAEHGPCVDCGTWRGLQVDHADASSKVTHRVWSWTAKRREIELAKCVTRCDPCHKRKSAGEKAAGEKHGAALLKEKDIPLIRASSEPRKVLADRYGVSQETIKSIRARRSWAHVK